MNAYRSTLSLFFLYLTFFVGAQCSTITNPEYGDNTWIVRAYNTKYYENVANSNYYGYYTQKLDVTNNYGVSTSLQWEAVNTGKPSQATAFSNTNGTGTAYAGCALPNQDFTFVHKRRGFPAGQYEIFVDRWDDKTEVRLDGVVVVTMADYGNNTHAPKCIYLDQNSRLEVLTDNRGGSMSELRMRIIRTQVNISINPLVANICRSETAVLTASASQISTITNNTTTITPDLTNMSWTGGPIVSGQGTATATVNPLVNTSYTYSATYKNCLLTGSVLVNVQQPPGDPNAFGINTWNVHGYHDGTATNDLSTLNYYGYYTQTLPGILDYGFNTNNMAQGGWGLLTSPSYSSTWTGCNLPNVNSFTYVHKRKGFPCGTYKISMDRYDNNTRIYINGNLVHSFTTNCVTNNCNEFELPILYELNANSTIEVRTNELGGDSWARMYIRPIRTETLANHNEQKTCPVRGDQWVDFYTHPEGRYLASVRGTSPTSDLGNVTVKAFVDATNQMALACNNVDHITAVMQRHWLMNATLNGQAEVRLPYKDQEFIQLDAASILSVNPDDRVYYPNQSSVKLSKYNGPNENGNVNDNCGGNAMMYEANNANFNAATYHYQDFIVPGFSEFWLHGSDYVTALPIVLKNFSVECTDNGQDIEIQAMVENKTDYLRVEFSNNGLAWDEIFKKKVTPNPGEYQTFNFFYPSKREGYYRLSTIEKTGDIENHQIIHQRCLTGDAFISLYPNPASDQLMIQINYPAATVSDMTILIVDVSGKEVAQHFIQVNGTNINVPISVADYAKGTYLVHITDSNQNKWIPKQLIIQ